MNGPISSWWNDWKRSQNNSKRRKKNKYYPELEPLENRWLLTSNVDFDSSTYSVTEDYEGSATITVTLDQAVTQTSTIAYATADNTATAGEDYTAASGTLTWEPEDGLSKSFTVTILGDSLDEYDETVNLSISNPTGDIQLGTTTSATLTIYDDDSEPDIDFSPSGGYTVGEGDGSITVTIELSAESGKTVTADYLTEELFSAEAGSDYTSTSGSLTFNPGETSKTFDVTILEDSDDESTESFYVNLENATNTSNDTANSSVSIEDNDPGISFATSNFTVDEDVGTATVTVTLDITPQSAVSVDYATSDALAIAGEDYTSTSGTLNWSALDPVSKTFTVTISTDNRREFPEHLILTLSNPSSGSSLKSPSTAFLTINDVPPAEWRPELPPVSDPNWEDNEKVAVGTGKVDLFLAGYGTEHAIEVGAVCGCGGGDPLDFMVMLDYESITANPRPIFQVTWQGESGDPLPDNIKARLTWDGGAAQSWTTFDTTGHSATDNYLVAVQQDTAVTASGYYHFLIELQANFTGAPTQVTRFIEGYAAVQYNDATFGKGWSIAGLEKLQEVTEGVLWVSGSGGARYFADTATGGYTSPDGDLGTLVKNGDNTYTYTGHNKVQYNFDSSGYLTTIVDTHNLALTFAYSAGLVSTVTEPDGDVYTFTYSSGELTKITQPGGHVTTVTIDAGDDLTVIENPDGALRSFTYDAEHKMTKDDFGLLTTSVTYDANADTVTQIERGGDGAAWAVTPQLTKGLDTNLNLAADETATATDSASNLATYTLDDMGQPTKIATADGNDVDYTYNDDGQVLTYTDQNNKTTSYSYSAAGNLSTVTDALNKTWTYTYDTNWNKVKTVEDPLSHVGTYSYDASTGDLLTYKDALNNVTSYTWTNGQMATMEDANGNVTSYSYNSSRQLEVIEDALNGLMTYSYNSAGKVETIEDQLGRTTSFEYDDMGRRTKVIDADNGTATFLYDASGLMTSQTDRSGVRTDYVYNASGLLTLQKYGVGTSLEQTTTMLHDAFGNVTQTTDPGGNNTQYLYDSLNRATVTIDALNNRNTSVLDAAGNVTQVFDGNNNDTEFVYDALNRATVTIDALGNRTTVIHDAAGNATVTIDAENNRTTQVMDALNRASVTIDANSDRTTTLFDAAGNVTQVTDARSNSVKYTYDALNRQTVFEDQLGKKTTSTFDAVGNVTQVKDANNNLTKYEFDNLNRATVTIDALNNRTSTLFDSKGNATVTIDAEDNRTSFLFDALNRASVTIDAEDGRTTTLFDAAGNVTQIFDQNNNDTEYVYDALNRATVTVDALGGRTTTIHDKAGNATVTIDAEDNRTTFVMDALNRASVTIDAEDGRTTTLFDKVGNVTQVFDQNNNDTEYLYDALNRASVTIDADSNRTTTLFDKVGNVTQVTDARSNSVKYTYDAANRNTVVEDALGNKTTTTFDAAGNATVIEDAGNNLTTYVMDALNRASVTIDANDDRTTTLFDKVGNATQVTDARSNVTKYTFDDLYRQTVVEDDLGNKTTTSFDAVGNVTSIKDASNNLSTFAFDALNRKTSETDPHGNTATFAYNSVGLMTATTDRLGRERLFEYDALYRKTTEIWENTSGTPVETMTYSFDANSNMLTATDSDGTYTMVYDGLNRVTVAHDMWGKTLTMTYDAVSNRTKVEDSDGGVATSTYNAGNLLTKREFKDGTPELRLDFAYNSLNQMTDITRYSDLAGTSKVATTSFSYEAVGRIDHMQHKDGSGTNIANYTYTYDSVGNLIDEELNSTFTTYTHDDTNQLTADGTTTVTYDATGNRNNGSYTTGTGNQITGDGTWTYSYDAEGSLTKKTKGASAETWTYGYDHRNQMTWVEKRATDGGTLQLRTDYEYDVFGNRIDKQVDEDGDSTVDFHQRYSLDGWKPGGGFVGNENWDVWADLYGATNNLNTRYLRGDAIDELFARIEPGDITSWTLTDRMLSVRDVIINDGTVKNTLVYDGFGKIISESDHMWRGRYAWTGRELDVETNLQYNRARYYSSEIGRWISQDPLGFEAGDANLYRYSKNQPTNDYDPSGLASIVIGIEGIVTTFMTSQISPVAGIKLVYSAFEVEERSAFRVLVKNLVEQDRAAQGLNKAAGQVILNKPGNALKKANQTQEFANDVSKQVNLLKDQKYTVTKSKKIAVLNWAVVGSKFPKRSGDVEVRVRFLQDVAGTKGKKVVIRRVIRRTNITFCGAIKDPAITTRRFIQVTPPGLPPIAR